MLRRRLLVGVGAVAIVAPMVFGTGGIASGAVPLVNLAGYQEAVTSPTVSVVEEEVVPTMGTCPALATPEVVVAGGLVGTSSGHTGGGVSLLCDAGVTTYAPFIQINNVPTSESNAVSPGDTVTVVVVETATASTVMLHDVTKGWSVSSSGGGGTPSGAGVGLIAGDCSGGDCFPVPAFSGSAYIGLINGGLLSGASATNLTAAAGAAEASPSKLISGALFAVTYHFTCTPVPPSSAC